MDSFETDPDKIFEEGQSADNEFDHEDTRSIRRKPARDRIDLWENKQKAERERQRRRSRREKHHSGSDFGGR